MARTLYIVRHGNTFNKGDTVTRVGARTDLPLSSSGQAQAEALADHFRPIAFAQAIAGPLKRTRQTAEAILAEQAAPPELEIGNFLREIDYGPAELDQLQLAYAITIHKSQGSEYPAVVIPLLTQHYRMLQRNLLYTAITRGKQVVILVGSRKAIEIAVGNAQVAARWWMMRAARAAMAQPVAAEAATWRMRTARMPCSWKRLKPSRWRKG